MYAMIWLCCPMASDEGYSGTDVTTVYGSGWGLEQGPGQPGGEGVTMDTGESFPSAQLPGEGGGGVMEVRHSQ